MATAGGGEKGMKKRRVDIPTTKEKEGGGEGEVLKMVKATTPKGLREVKNVLRWYAFLPLPFFISFLLFLLS